MPLDGARGADGSLPMLLLVLGIAAAVVFSGHLERPNGMGTTMLMVIFERNQGVLWSLGFGMGS
jgi:hypothetical protein